MPNNISTLRVFRGSGTDGVLYNFATFNRWNGDRNVNVNRNNNDWNDNWWFAGRRYSFYFSPII